MKTPWIRAIVAAVLLEVALFAITIPVVMLFSMEAFIPFVPPVCLVAAIPFGWWSVRTMKSGFVMQGLLVGIVATLIYFALVLGMNGSIQPVVELYGSVRFVVTNALKILGCVAGAYAGGRRRILAPAL